MLGAGLPLLNTTARRSMLCSALFLQTGTLVFYPQLLTSLHSFPPRAPSASVLHQSSSCNSSPSWKQWEKYGKGRWKYPRACAHVLGRTHTCTNGIDESDGAVEFCLCRNCLMENKWPRCSIRSVSVALTRRTWVPRHQSTSCTVSCPAQKQPVSPSLLSPSGILNWQELNSHMPGRDPSLLNAITFRLFENKNWHEFPESNLVIMS